METTPQYWPWIALIMALAGFAAGYMTGQKRFFLWWGPATCGAACTCAGVACGLGPPAAPAHAHCPRIGMQCRRACSGTCTAAPGHAGAHTCSHAHAF